MDLFSEVSKRISPYMKSKGFRKSGKHYCIVTNDVAYCIGFDMAGGLLYTTAYVMPLYIPCQNRYYSYGSRLDEMKDTGLPLLGKDASADAIDGWCKAFYFCIEKVIVPFFEQISTPQKIVAYTERLSGAAERFSCPTVWLWRLKMFTYLYLRDCSKARATAKHYRKQLINASFLTDAIREEYLEEIDAVTALVEESCSDLENYFLEIINQTRKII